MCKANHTLAVAADVAAVRSACHQEPHDVDQRPGPAKAVHFSIWLVHLTGRGQLMQQLQQLYTALVEADVAGGREAAWEDE
jgi:hypothetical protein